MDNRPIALKEPIIAFNKSDLNIKLNYPEGYPMPDQIEMELWVGSIKPSLPSPIIATITGETAEFTISFSDVKFLPSQADAYFLHDGNFLFGAKLFVQSGFVENPDPVEMNVSFSGDQVVVVEVMGLDMVKEQVLLAEQQVALAEQQVVLAQDQVSLATAQTVIATQKAAQADVAKLGAEAARDAAIVQAGVYTTEALGRAAVADGQAFKVQGVGEVAAYEYRRVNSGSSTLIATYPSAVAVTNRTVNLSAGTNDYSTGQALDGAVKEIDGRRVKIPAGQIGANSYVRPRYFTKSMPSWNEAIGVQVTFVWTVKISSGLSPARTFNAKIDVTRGDTSATNIGVSPSVVRISDNQLVCTARYTPTSADTEFRPYVQIITGTAAGVDHFFEYETLTYSFIPATGATQDNNFATSRITEYLAAEANKASLRVKAMSYKDSGQAVAGATLANKRVTIPANQTGNGAYTRPEFKVSDIPGYADLIGQNVEFSMIIGKSSNFTRGLTVHLTVRRSGADATIQETNLAVTSQSSTFTRANFKYIPQAGDEILKPFVQLQTGSAIASDSYFEIQDLFLTPIVPVNYPTDSSYVISKLSEILNGKILALESGSANTNELTVKTDGTGNYLTPALANAAINNSSALNPYDVIIFQGVYTDTETILKAFVTFRGQFRDVSHLKGELPSSADDSHRTTSTLWLQDSSGLKNLKITAKNMRYAVHDESSGVNVNAIHTVDNCYIEHYGNADMIAWRTANPGSGLLVSNVWASARPYGYGAASGLVLNMSNTTLVSLIEAFYVHSNQNFTKPNINNLSNCSIIRKGSFGQVIMLESLGSGQTDQLNMEGCSISPGYIRQNDSPWISTAAANLYANHANYHVFAKSSSKVGYKDTTRGLALRIKSKSILATSTVRLSGNAAPIILGNTIFEVDGGVGLEGYAYGYWDISGILCGSAGTTQVNNTLGRRLGDCTSSPKTLTITVDGGAPINVVFNTNLTAVSNATILATITTAISSVATVDEYNPALNEYYPYFGDREVTLVNTGASGIPRFNAVSYNSDKTNIRLISLVDPASNFIGVALENIPVGKSGRVLLSGVLERFIQIPGISPASATPDTDNSLIYGTPISLSSTQAGQFEFSSSKIVMRGAARHWAEF